MGKSDFAALISPLRYRDTNWDGDLADTCVAIGAVKSYAEISLQTLAE